MEICPISKCTGCGSCLQKCPKHCISLVPDSLSCVYPYIDKDKCISCGLCQKACPNNHDIGLSYPHKAYAAWSLDENDRRNSASGGIAAQLYKYCINHQIATFGVVWSRERGAHFIKIESERDIEKVRNSKYVYSDTNNTYQIIKDLLHKGRKVLFIGLPCQVSGLYSFLGEGCENLLTVDIICHGVAPYDYLRQHICRIEKKKRDTAFFLSFRDPEYYTHTYTLTLRNAKNKVLYKNRVRSFDNYQLGYHHALLYRVNCYSCRYARPERIGDITIGDFSGLGKIEACTYSNRNVSCILVNTERGDSIVSSISDRIVLEQRPLGEALNFEGQLSHPSKPHPERKKFEKNYIMYSDFEKACKGVLNKDKLVVVFRKGLWRRDFRNILRLILPVTFVECFKKIVRR